MGIDESHSAAQIAKVCYDGGANEISEIVSRVGSRAQVEEGFRREWYRGRGWMFEEEVLSRLSSYQSVYSELGQK